VSEQIKDSDQELRLKLYGETRSDLLKRQLSNSENADRAILTVSTACLGFSLAFLKDVVPLHEATLSSLPYLSWASFVLSIVITLISFFTSQRAIEEQLTLAHRYYIERDETAAKTRPKFASITDTLNKSGAAFLVVGLLAICIFVVVNVGKGANMTDKRQIDGGAPVPRMQGVPSSGNTKGMALDGAPIPQMQAMPQGDSMQKGATIPTLQTIPSKPQVGAPVPGLQPLPSVPDPTTNQKGS